MMEDDEDTKPTIDISTLPPKQAAFALLKENGLTNNAAADVLGYSKGTARVISHKINKLSLTNTKTVKSASQAVKNILAGQPWGSINKIKDSTALQAAQMVYDRVEPVVRQNVNLNANVNISPVDLTPYRNNNK